MSKQHTMSSSSYLLGPVEASMQSHVAIEGLVVLKHAATLGALHRLGWPAVGKGGGGGRGGIQRGCMRCMRVLVTMCVCLCRGLCVQGSQHVRLSVLVKTKCNTV